MRKKQTLIKPLTLAIHLALTGAAAGLVVPTTAMAQQQTVEFNIPAGELGTALTQAAAQAGVLLSFDPKLTQGKTTPGLKGTYSTRDALQVLINETNLMLTHSNNQFRITSAHQPAHQLAPITVTSATKTERTLNQLTSSVEVIDAAQIERSGQTTLDGVLRELSNVYVSPTGNSFSVRGARTLDNLILIDGRRLNGEASMRYELNRITATQIERVEIVKGPASVLYGSDALGGVINVITKKPQQGMQADIFVQAGLGNHADVATRDLGINLSGGNAQTQFKGYFGFSQRDPYSVTTTSNTEVACGGGNRCAPSTHTNPNVRNSNLKDRYQFDVNRLDKNEVINLGVSLIHQFNQNLEAGINVDYMHEDRRIDYIGGRQDTNITTGGQNKATAFNLPTRWTDDNKRIDVSAHLEWQVLNELRLHYQVYNSHYDKSRSVTVIPYQDLNYTSAEQTNAAENNSTSDLTVHEFISTWTPNNLNTIVMGAEHRDHGTRDNSAIYAQHEWQILDNFTTVYGARYDKTSVDAEKTSIKAGWVHNITPNFLWRANFAQGFKVGAGREYNSNHINPSGRWMLGAHTERAEFGKTKHDLNPEVSENYELGIAGNLFSTDYSLTVFQNDIKDLISRVTENQGAGDYLTFRNTGKAQIRGIEWTLNRDLTDRFNIGFSTTWLDAQNLDNNKQLTNSPEYTARLSANWWVTEALDINASLNHIGKQYTDTENTEYNEAFNLANLGASYRPSHLKKWEVYARVDNLLDEKNETSLYTNPGRYFKLGARWHY